MNKAISRRYSGYLLASAIVINCNSCAIEPRAESKHHTPTTTTVLGPLHTQIPTDVTWRDYNGADNPTEAMYILDGQPIGRGKAGFEVLLEKLSDLPQQSAVLVHPSGFWGVSRDDIGGDHDRTYLPPFWKYYREFDAIIRARRLRLILDSKDENGHIPPTYAPR